MLHDGLDETCKGQGLNTSSPMSRREMAFWSRLDCNLHVPCRSCNAPIAKAAEASCNHVLQPCCQVSRISRDKPSCKVSAYAI